ncbi:unnamed protein product [Tuber aestivum]|uniref:Uncharacterized protein n=1 Tax=Tuber aestivum TaxID=59557 RepID=A0A292PJ75_9PEZI|nr:unnamed protein product [Tuber aestivum]
MSQSRDSAKPIIGLGPTLFEPLYEQQVNKRWPSLRSLGNFAKVLFLTFRLRWAWELRQGASSGMVCCRVCPTMLRGVYTDFPFTGYHTPSIRHRDACVPPCWKQGRLVLTGGRTDTTPS